MSLCLRRDFSAKDARLCSRNMLTCASAATTATHQGVWACVWICVFVRARQRCVFPVLASQYLLLCNAMAALLMQPQPFAASFWGLLGFPSTSRTWWERYLERQCEGWAKSSWLTQSVETTGQICVIYVLLWHVDSFFNWDWNTEKKAKSQIFLLISHGFIVLFP